MAGKILRSPDYGRRLEMACDQQPLCPPLHKGRYQWIVDEYRKRFNESLTTETVRKWAKGESRPTPDKNALTAQLLGVDPAWLYLGTDVQIEPRERRVRDAQADGVVNVVAGLVRMDGGTPAFPTEDDKRAKDENIDLYAVIKGAQYAFQVVLAADDGTFHVPTRHETAVVLGVRRSGLKFDIVELPHEVIAAGKRRGGTIEVTGAGRPVTGFDRRL